MPPRKEKTFNEFIIKYLKNNTSLCIYDKNIIIENRLQRVDFKCECGGVINRTSHYIISQNIKKCKECNRKTQTQKKIDKLNTIIKYCEENIPHIKLLSNIYLSVSEELDFYCETHDFYFKKIPALILQNKNGCEKCFSDSISSEKSSQYNPNLPEHKRLKARKTSKVIKWRNNLLKLYNKKCYICGHDKKYNLIAHHKNSHDWCKKEAYDINNGVILCKNCHSEFHYIYGYGNNTKEQFEKYLKDFKNIT